MLHRNARLWIIFTLVIASGLGLIAGVPGETDAAGGALVTVLPDAGNSALYAEVDPVRGGIVTFTGKVIVEQPVDIDAQYVSIQLVAEVEGWQVTQIPLMTSARLPAEIPFSVSTVVPQFTATSGLDATKTMSISGTWSYEPGLITGQVQPVEVFIYIKQFYQYSVRSPTPNIQTAPGGEFDLTLEIMNEGNGDDEFGIEIQNRERMEDNGWTFIFDQAKFNIPHGETLEVTFKVTTPKKWDAFRNNIVVLHFIVTSHQAVNANAISETAFYSVYVRQRGVAIPGFEAPLMLLAVLAVLSIAYVKRRR